MPDTCGQCGTRLSKEARFCPRCGVESPGGAVAVGELLNTDTSVPVLSPEQEKSARRRGRAIRLYLLLAASALLMVIGHWLVLSSGGLFDQRSGQRYNLFTNWVSDFAAKHPEGYWIKGAIVVFCIALAEFTAIAISSVSENRFTGMAKLWWLLIATAMIGGLMLVILFDKSPQQYAFKDPWNWPGKWWEEVPRSRIEQVMRGQHDLGFLLFVVGFLLAAVSVAAGEWRSRRHAGLATSLYYVSIATVLCGWLFAIPSVQTMVPGVPQRAFLLLVFAWLIRNVRASARQ